MSDLALFEPWPKTPRLRRDITITEKIDGTNAQISIREVKGYDYNIANPDECDRVVHVGGGSWLAVRAGSRKRWIKPGDDNYGFAAWVWEHAEALAPTLGVGRHYGEWWGQGIQRNYGVDFRRFSLFNTHRWTHGEHGMPVPPLVDLRSRGIEIDVVPKMYTGPWTNEIIDAQLHRLRTWGSMACASVVPAEGIVVFHHASQQVFKILLENDELPKGVTTRQERDAQQQLVFGA